MRNYFKRTLLAMLAFMLLTPSFASASEADQGSPPVPPAVLTTDIVAPLFQWDFEQVNEAKVVNSVYPDNRADDAELKGTASVISDELRGNVLSRLHPPRCWTSSNRRKIAVPTIPNRRRWE